MNIGEGWVAVIAIGAFVAGLAIGCALTLDSVADDCKDVHGFHHNRVVYECHTQPAGDDHG